MDVQNTDFNKLQADILLKNTADNPLFAPSNIDRRDHEIKTVNKSIRGAINELLNSQTIANKQMEASLKAQFKAIGDSTSDPKLLDRLLEVCPNLIEGMIQHSKQIDEIMNYARDDHEDEYHVDGTPQVKFTLTHKPIGKIRIYIDGIRYFKSCYTYDAESNSVIWDFTAKNGGFDIADADVVLEYDYEKESNKK